MFTPTHTIYKIAAAILLTALMSGCGHTGFRAKEAASRFAGPPPSKMSVAGGMLIVSGPEGFCIDREASREEVGGSALVMLAPCQALGSARSGPVASHNAVITAAVAAHPRVVDVGQIEPMLRHFFATAEGRATLSRSGKAASVTVHKSYVEDGTYYLYLRDTAPFKWGKVQPDYWRALLPAGGRMVTLSAFALPDAPIDEASSRVLLKGFVDAVKAGSILPVVGKKS